MKKKSNIILTAIVAMVALIVIFWVVNEDNDSSVKSEDIKEVTVMIYANEEELANDTIEVNAEAALLEIMEDHYDMNVSDEGFVEAIEGVEQSVDDNKYWVYEANEEMVPESAEDFVPEDGDMISWELVPF
ncbi:DUF4430 domain-containing protein [Alkalibacterium kapii]|uniref:Transcobalamin-like C-terminal domain-containing protein n=1 Tax=Alkalibacterium kapii TaxID=426704 RepID=A0A511B252_9LACT|nr:DUF4430 domain-containing protein [Alkalibacterium kapii]GEK91897.1 hypothetical protein AKA01nite_15190 [Alkalibacterium kapii]